VAIIIDADDGPDHDPATKPVVEAVKPDAAAINSAANPCHAAPADNREPDPAPEYMEPELTSGGNAP
jgi:hypothetical protein